MEPIPETTRAADELDPLATEDALLDRLRRAGDEVRRVAPACRGLSVTLVEHGVTLTLVASDEEVAAMDAVQYLAGGPCVETAQHGQVIASDNARLDESGWHLFAAATAAHGISSTLSLPLLKEGAVVGSVNLYGATPDAFDDLHEELAVILGAWEGGAVRNADLPFSTRQDAQRAPQVLHDARRVDNATGMLAARLQVTTADARRRLEEAATAAGLPVVAVAEEVLGLLRWRDPADPADPGDRHDQ